MSIQEIYNYLKTHGCCNICCLRFFNGRCDDYVNADKQLETKGIIIDNVETVENDSKRFKQNPCIACLGLFDGDFLDTVLTEIENHSTIHQYKCETVLTSVSLPISLSLRQVSIWIGLLKTFPNSFSAEKIPDVPLKEVIKLILNPRVCQRLGKTFEQNQNGLMVNVFFVHEDEAEELKLLSNVNPTIMHERLATPRKFHREFMTRNAFDKHFTPDKIDLNLFCKHIAVPGTVPSQSIKFDRITVQGPTVFVAGRYRKLSRELSQSPWILQGKRMMDSSVQEIIIEQIVPHFGLNIDQAIFSSSGREDVDVRCLGRGRPFVVELPNAKEVKLSHSVGRAIEHAVDQSARVSITHLQMIEREDLIHIKTGEETKTKLYQCLCLLKEPATVGLMEKLNISTPFTIHQKTPLRVLHRRPLATRDRIIHSVRGWLHKDNYCQVILNIETQAGTYVKELIHGEFNRTTPNIRSIIGQWIDIVELDVMDIVLDWPPEIKQE